MRTVAPGEIYRHFKNKLYQIVAVAYHSETKEKYVVYQALYGDFKTYIRPYDMFLSEVDHDKYPDVKQLYRFEKLDPEKDLGESCIPHNPVNAAKSAEDVSIATESVKETVTNDEQVNPLLMEFFDQDTAAEKIEYLRMIHTKIDNRLINDIAASLDLTVDEGDVETRYISLINCLKTMARFETGRLR